MLGEVLARIPIQNSTHLNGIDLTNQNGDNNARRRRNRDPSQGDQ